MNENTLTASFLVANRVVTVKKPVTNTIGEELILPSTKGICCELLRKAAFKRIVLVVLLLSTVTRHKDEIAKDKSKNVSGIQHRNY